VLTVVNCFFSIFFRRFCFGIFFVAGESFLRSDTE